MKLTLYSGLVVALLCAPLPSEAARGVVVRLIGQSPGSIAALHFTPLSGPTVETALADDGQSPDVVANDGVLSGNALLPDAEYRLKLVHNGTQTTGTTLTIKGTSGPSDLEVQVVGGQLQVGLRPVVANGTTPAPTGNEALPPLPEGTQVAEPPPSIEAALADDSTVLGGTLPPSDIPPDRPVSLNTPPGGIPPTCGRRDLFCFRAPSGTVYAAVRKDPLLTQEDHEKDELLSPIFCAHRAALRGRLHGVSL